MSIMQMLFFTEASSSYNVTNDLEDVFNFSAFGDSSTVASVTSRAGCFGRDSSFNYENYVWIVVGDDLRKYTYSGGSWSLTLTTDSPLGTNILGCADNGTHVLLCDSAGNAALYNKSTNTFGASRSIGGGNAQGASWDGTQWVISQYNNQTRVYRVNADNTSTLGFSTILDGTPKRGIAYDFDLYRHWVFAAGADDETFAGWDGSSFGTVQDWDDYDSNVTAAMLSSTTSDDGDFFITTTGEKFLVQFDSGVIRVRAKLTDASGSGATSGHQLFTSTGTTSFTVPAWVTSICVLCVGGGGGGVGANGSTALNAGGGGGGGALYYKNNYTVTPGDTLTVKVGAGGSGGPAASTNTGRIGNDGDESSVKIGATTICLAEGGSRGLTSGVRAGDGGSTSNCVGDGGGSGGTGGAGGNNVPGGAGGAGGYAGAGGAGSSGTAAGSAGSGGAGGGGGRAAAANAGGGGGVGLLGQGTSGSGGASANDNTAGGGGGSGGNDGVLLTAGTYGGGGGSRDDGNSGSGGDGGDGAVRILWGAGRAFPSTNVSSATN